MFTRRPSQSRIIIGDGIEVREAGLVGFLPTDIAGLTPWIDFSDVIRLFIDAAKTTPVSSDDDLVGAAEDKSGQGNDLTQALTANKLKYKTGIQNGLSVGRFDGINDFLSGALARPSNFSVFVVAQKTDVTARRFMCGSLNAAGQNTSAWGGISGKEGVNGDIGYIFGDDINSSRGRSPGGIVSNNTFFLAEAIYTAGQDAYKMWKDAVSQAITTITTAATACTGVANDYSIGRIGEFNGLYWDGDIAEILVYNTALSAEDRQSVETYLNSKWAIF